MSDAPSVAAQSAAVRHVAAGGDITPEIRRCLDAAVATLDYHAARPSLMRACAYFERTAAWNAELFEAFPDARIAQINTPLEDNGGWYPDNGE